MKIKEILVLHHSHLDVGYTHSQPILWEMQREYLDLALDFLDATADYPAQSLPRWTCEVTSPIIRWLETASAHNIARFARYLQAGRIGISGFEYNTTPLCSAEQLARQLYPAQILRERFAITINTVNQHDVNGVPWSMVDVMLDAGIELFIMAINMHFGGAAANRPCVFRWQAPSGRELLVMNGNHYTMFDQLLYSWDHSIERMQQGLAEYHEVLDAIAYPHDFLYLTTTNPPQMWDNAPPNLKVAELIRQWNDAGTQPAIRYVTPAMLLDRIRQIPPDTLPVYRGDWTDYWNFGSASTAHETRINQNAKPALFTADLLRAFRSPSPEPALDDVSQRAWNALNLYDEHTWGASESIRLPDHPHTRVQNRLKLIHAYEASELAQYLLLNEVDAFARNPAQADEQQGVLLLNPTAAEVTQSIALPDAWFESGKRLRTNRFSLQGKLPSEAAHDFGPVTLPPFSWRKLPLGDLQPVQPAADLTSSDSHMENAFYRLEINPENGRITRLYDKKRRWEVLPSGSDYSLFEFIHEQPDPRIDSRRTALYKRDMQKEKFGLSCWQTDWVAQRRGTTQLLSCHVTAEARKTTLELKFSAPGVDWLDQRLTLHADSALIDLDVRLMKKDIRTPEAIYFVLPLNLAAGWQAHFDSAGIPLALDDDQLPGACRDWVTVESFASVHDDAKGAALFCPDAPMAQIGGFNFGRKQDSIPREANPLLLAWPLNNYWDTNFAASQPGFIHLRYQFMTHGQFDAAHIMNQTGGLLAHPLIACPQAESGTMLTIDNPHIRVLHIKPAASGEGVLMRLVNLSAQAESAALTFPGKRIETACYTTITEQNQDTLSTSADSIRLQLPPRQIVSLRAVLRNQ